MRRFFDRARAAFASLGARGRSSLVALARWAAANPYATVFLVGFTAFVAGVAQWSGPLAATVGGALLMLVAVWPFLNAPKGQP